MTKLNLGFCSRLLYSYSASVKQLFYMNRFNNMMLGTFPKAFSQAAPSQRYFFKCQPP